MLQHSKPERLSNFNAVVKKVNEQTHGPRPAAVEVMKAVSTMCEQAAATLDNPKQIVSGNVGALSQDGAENLPLVDALSQKIHHVRKVRKRAPPNPTSL